MEQVVQAEAPDSGRARGGRSAAESDSAAVGRHVRRRYAKRNVDGECGRASTRPAEGVREAAGGVAPQGRGDVEGTTNNGGIRPDKGSRPRLGKTNGGNHREEEPCHRENSQLCQCEIARDFERSLLLPTSGASLLLSRSGMTPTTAVSWVEVLQLNSTLSYNEGERYIGARLLRSINHYS